MLNVTLRENVSRMKADISIPMRRAMIWSTNLIRRYASINAPFKSGTLRRSITTSVTRDWRQGRVWTNVPYARRREFENYKNPWRKYYMKRAKMDSASQIEDIFVKELDLHFSWVL